MPKLIDPLARERPVPRETGALPRLQRVSPGGAEARGLEVLGQALGAGAEELYQAQQREEERINSLRAEEAYTQLRERQLDLTIGEQNGFAKVKGADAVKRPLLIDWLKRFDDANRELASGLANDTQREKFARRTQVARLQYQEDILRHLAREGDEYAKQVFDGALLAEQRQVVARWDSPADVASSMERIRNLVAERASALNWDEQFKSAVLAEQQAKIHTSVIQQAIAGGNYRYAEQWYEKHRGEIDLPTARLLAAAVRDGSQKELGDRYRAEYLTQEHDHKGLEQLRQRVLADSTLDEGRRNVLVGQIQNRQYALERRAEVLEARRLRVIERQLREVNANTLAGFEPPAERLLQLVKLAQGTELEAEARAAANLATATRAFRGLAPLAQERHLAQAEAGIREDPSKVDRNVVSAWRQIHEAQRRAATENPVSFAVRQGIIAAPQLLDLSDPLATAGALHERFAIARALANRYSTPVKPLTEEETKLAQAFVRGATPQQKTQWFGALASASGGDIPGYMAIMAQIASDDPVTAIAGSQAARGRTAQAELILRGQAILAPSTKADGKPDSGSLLPMPSEVDLRMNFDNLVRDAFAGEDPKYAEARSAHFQAAKAAYAALSLAAGDRDTKVFQADRWRQAVEVAIGKIERYPGMRGRYLVLPHGYELDQFRDEMRARLNDLAVSGRLDPMWNAERLRDLPLQNVGDGRYILRTADGAVTDKTGQRVIINFNLPAPPIEQPAEPTPEEFAAAERPYLSYRRLPQPKEKK